MQKVPFSVDIRVKLEKLKLHCCIVHSAGYVQSKYNFLEHICKKFDDNLNGAICVLYKQCTCSQSSSEKGNLCSGGNKRDKIIKMSGGMCLGTEVAPSQLPGQWD